MKQTGPLLPAANDLAYFLEVAQTLNLSRAAERLGIAQPSLTLAVQRLERALGAPVLSRGRRGVTLTQAGRQLLTHSRDLLESWERARGAALSSLSEVQGSYTLGCHPAVALYSLPHFLPQLLSLHPKLDVRLKHDLSRKIAEGIVSSTIDIGIVVNPVRHPDLVITRLCVDEVTLWRATSTRATDSRKRAQRGESLGVLLCDPELAQAQWLLRQLKKAHMEPTRIVSSSSLEVIASLTAHGAGTGILPTRVAATAPLPITRVDGAPVFRDEICLIYRVENRGVKAIQTIATAVKSALGEPG